MIGQLTRALDHDTGQTTARCRARGAPGRATSPPGARVAATLLGAALAMAAGGTLAVDTGFELDGNALEDVPDDPIGVDDWETLHNAGGNASAYTGVITDPSPKSIFGGGNKDIQDIGQWSHKGGSVPDKSDITNAYAAAYDNPLGELVVYFGADRVANSGDTFMGFWFFKQLVRTNDDGTFSGAHENGDVLVLVNFPQANNAVPLVQVISWDDTCPKAASSSPQEGQCAAKNLRLLAGASGAGAVCPPAGSDDFCAITNEEFTDNAAPNPGSSSPWDYLSKDGFVNQFPFETFFEGGINLSQVVGGDTCFASFLAETRSSSSFTAQLKDFALGDFPVCSIDVSKVCGPGALTADNLGITYPISGTVTNEGFGTVYDVSVTDSPAFDAGSLQFTGPGDPTALTGGSSVNYTATMTVPLAQNGTSDTVTATANTAADGLGTPLEAMDTAQCPNLTVNPALVVTKECVTAIDVVGGNPFVAARVNVSGSVCNDVANGDGSTVFDITLEDDSDAVLTPSSIAMLSAGQCVDYTGSYLPTSALDANGDPTTVPTEVLFKDTVTATGTSVFGSTVEHSDMATCPLCP